MYRRTATAATALGAALVLAACGGLSDDEKRFVAFVQSQTHTTMSEDALLQAGYDSCKGKSDASGDLQFTIALAAVGTLCKK